MSMNSPNNIRIQIASCFWQCAIILILAFNCNFVAVATMPHNANTSNSFENSSLKYSNSILFAQDSIPSIWKQIDLTSPRMKQEAKVFPWWVPISAGAAGVGILILVLNDNNDENPQFVVNDDVVNQECGKEFSFDPTLNDLGSGIKVVSITGESEYGLVLNGNTIFFPTSLNMNINILVTLEDEFGNSGQSTITVILSNTPIDINDRNHVVDINESVTGNLFSGSVCASCVVNSFEGDEQFGTFSISSTGDYSFTPNNNFIGRAVFDVSVSDNCFQTANVKITIDVRGENCNIDPVITTENTECGAAIGLINIGVSPQERYDIIWEDGDFSFERNNLSAGEYSFRIIDQLGLCEEEFVIRIEEKPLNLASDVEISSATCLGGGEITINLNRNVNLEYNIEFEGSQFLQFTSSENPVKLQDIENLFPGEYSIFINIPGRPARCGETINLTLAEETFPLEAIDDIGTTDINIPWQGNVLINDIGTGIKVTGFEPPLNGSSAISEDGEAIFTPNLNFSGIVIFQYTIQDTCGNTSNAQIRIEVLSDCLFTTEITTSPSQCGLNNGRASIMISPEIGPYLVTWSTGQMSNQILNLSPGNYSVTVLDILNDCSRIVSFNITESEAILVEDIMVENATCITGGRISGSFNSQYSSPFRIEVFFENEFQGAFQFNSVSFDLQPLLNLKPGTYRLVFSSVSLGNVCEEEIIIEMGTDDLPMEIVNDSATININTFWFDNVLDNDSGTGLRIISFTQAPNGTVNIQQNGETLFTPNLNFVGETSFNYTARDTCGAEMTGTVFIEVIQNCSFTGNIFTTDATCGENDGSAMLVLSPPGGNYQIVWSSGDMGLVANNLPSGQITVTVTDVTNSCSKVFVNTVNEIEPKIVDVVQTTPAECTGGGNIFGTFVNSYPGPYRILVFRNGIFLGSFNFSGPTFSLDEVLQIIPGNYTIIVNSISYNPDCSQRILLEVEEVPTVIITNNDTFETPENTSVSGNVLNNDIGQNLLLIDISAPQNGSITYLDNGSFTYTPNPDFVGVELLNYTVIDICLTTAVGNLRIVVTEGPTIENKNTHWSFVNNINSTLNDKSSTLYFNTLNIQPNANTHDHRNSGIFQQPIYSLGVNSLIHNKATNNLLSTSLSFFKPISSSNLTSTTYNYTMDIEVGKTLNLSRNVLIYSMIGSGFNLLNNPNNVGQLIPHFNLSNGLLFNLNKSFSLGINHNFRAGIRQLFNQTELKIYNNF